MPAWPLARGRDRFDHLLVTALPDLWSYAVRLERDAVRAEDLLQESAAKALGRFGQLRDEGAFRTWIHRVVYHTWLHRRDKASTRREHADGVVIELAVSRHDPEREAASSALGGRLDAALATLPEAQRDAVLLVDGQDLTFAEAADVLGVPPGTVASRVARGRLALRAALSDVALDHGVSR
jgi:RNA polymerase sigma-70 factor (ECF subfamily)